MPLLDIVHRVVWTLVYAAVFAGIAALAWSIVRFNLKRRAVEEALVRATPQQLDRVIELVESIGTEPPAGGILVRTNNRIEDERCIVTIPTDIVDFPWRGRSFEAKTSTDVAFAPTQEHVSGARLLGREYRFLAVPRVRTKSGKLRNVFAPDRYMKLCPELMSALGEILLEHPREALSYILCNGHIEFEPIDQLRIGTSAEWVQKPEWKYCSECGKRMNLIMQIPGACLHNKKFQEGTFYLFGCKNHPEITESLAQFS